MRIIKPLNNIGGVSSSDAPVDSLETWIPVGLNLLGFLKDPVFDVVDDLMIIASGTKGGAVYVYDLSTGSIENTGILTTQGALNISISPNKQFFFITRRTAPSGADSALYEIGSWAIKYSTGQKIVGGGIPTFYVAKNADWDIDSSHVYFDAADKIRKVSTATWLEINSYSFGYADTPFLGLTKIPAGLLVFYTQHVIKLSDSLVEINSIAQPSGALRTMTYNSALDDVICIDGDEMRRFNVTTLLPESLVASGAFFGGHGSLSLNNQYLIARSLSAAPYWNCFDINDYSFAISLPSLPTAGSIAARGTTYTVVQQDTRIALIDNTNNTVATQQNPSVTAGDTFIYNNYVYEVLSDNNDQPDLGAALPAPTWLNKGFINPLRMYDGKLDSLTTSDSDLSITVTANTLVTGIAVFNVDAATIQITMTDPDDGIVFDTDVVDMLDNSAVNDWFAYFFSPYIKKKDFATLDVPPYPDAMITVSIDGAGAGTAIGELVVGEVFDVGETQYNTSVGILDYSRKEQDQFGKFNIIKRRFSKRADYDIKIMTNAASGVQRTLADLRAEPAVFIGDADKEETIIYGYYRSFDISISSPSISDATITVEGL